MLKYYACIGIIVHEIQNMWKVLQKLLKLLQDDPLNPKTFERETESDF